MAVIADQHVNYFAMSETCANTNKYNYSNDIKEAFSQVLINGHLSLHNSPQYPSNSHYQPGGVAAGFDCTLRSNFIREGSDKYRRWVWQEFGDDDNITRIYTVYRVLNGRMENSGHCTAWNQQRLLLEKDSEKISNPRKHVMDSLLADVKTFTTKGHNVIVMGDFNEGLNSPEKNARTNAGGRFVQSFCA